MALHKVGGWSVRPFQVKYQVRSQCAKRGQFGTKEQVNLEHKEKGSIWNTKGVSLEQAAFTMHSFNIQDRVPRLVARFWGASVPD